MSEYTSITTDMRMLMGCFTGFTEFERDKFERLCDAIDAIHANLERENESLRRELDRVMGEHESDGWVELPKDGEAPSKQLAEWIENRGLVTGPLDANGELWHSGDMSDSPWGVIESIAFYGDHWQVSGHDTSAPWIPADSISHYHAPTVEDVLREMLDAWGELPSNATNEAIVAEYAAKLRLAGE